MDIGDAVPQFFHDLIAKIIPGVVLIICFCVVFDQLYYLKKLLEFSGISLFILAYVSGSLIHNFSVWCDNTLFMKKLDFKAYFAI